MSSSLCDIKIWQAWFMAFGPESLLVGFLAGYLFVHFGQWWRDRRRFRKPLEANVIPSNYRLVDVDGNQYFSKYPSLVVDGTVVMRVGREPLK